MKKTLTLFFTLILFINIGCKKTNPEKEEEIIPPIIEPEEPYTPTTNMIYINPDGSLGYNFFANQGEKNKINVIPDFSRAGYKGGGVAIPVVSDIKITLNPVSGDNLNQIQNAINTVGALTPNSEGIRGVILLKSGIYDVSNTITINKSGVILRGEGQGANGTVLIAKKAAQHNFINIHGNAEATTRTGSKKITTAYVGTGKKGFKIENGSGIAVGDRIGIYKTPNQQWITDLNVAQYGWTASGYTVDFERYVTQIIGDSIVLDAPVVDPIQVKYGGGLVYKLTPNQRITNSGVENLRISSIYASDEDENHAWVGVELKNAENCWVKEVTALYFGYSAISISTNSHFNTVEECAMLDPKSITTGSRKYSFNLEYGASFNLFQRCYARGGRHDFVTGSKVPGPNVFLDCIALATTADIGPHHRWATGLLFDNISGGQIRVQNRGTSGSGHGWSGAQTLFYNCRSSKSDIKVESAKGSMNWGIGCIGITKNGAGFWESWGMHAQPRSLYLAQLKDRLGNQAVENISTVAQRNGSLDQLLINWAGNGKLSNN